MADGKGCKCWAYSKHDCACDADWTPQEVYDLRTKVQELEEEIAELKKEIKDACNQGFEEGYKRGSSDGWQDCMDTAINPDGDAE